MMVAFIDDHRAGYEAEPVCAVPPVEDAEAYFRRQEAQDLPLALTERALQKTRRDSLREAPSVPETVSVKVEEIAGREPHVFEAGGIGRAAERRGDEAWLAERLRDPRSRFAPVWEHRTWFEPGAEPPRAAWLHAREAAPLVEAAGFAILLGAERETAFFAVPVADGETGAAGEWDDLRRHGLRMRADEAGLLAMARGMAYWHARHGFCGVCGGRTEAREAGHLRACTACGAHHFPRTDAAVIMRVEHEGRCLLGRQAIWDPGVYSVLAGFVEPGESLEDAVAREVMEEAGVPVADVRYHSSQPWPFPASLMVGFTARATATDIRPEDEMEEVRWFTREEVRRGVEEGTFRFPSTFSISYRLLTDWLDGGDAYTTGGPSAARGEAAGHG